MNLSSLSWVRVWGTAPWGSRRVGRVTWMLSFLGTHVKQPRPSNRQFSQRYYPHLTIVSNVFMRNGTNPLMLLSRVYNNISLRHASKLVLSSIGYYVYTKYLRRGFDMTQGQFLSGAFLVWIQGLHSCRIKTKQPNQPQFFIISIGETDGTIPFPNVFEQN